MEMMPVGCMRTDGGAMIREGDVVQIQTPANLIFDGMFAVVGEVRTWGVIADVYLDTGGIAPIRLATSEYQYVGRCPQTKTKGASDETE
jgi:hypothetical protein